MAEYLEGGLPSSRRQRLEEHLAVCADCCTSFANAVLFLYQRAGWRQRSGGEHVCGDMRAECRSRPQARRTAVPGLATPA